MLRVILMLLLAAPNLFGASWNVFGPDDRRPLPRHFPWSAVGQVSSDFACTGTLVGKRLVVTAAHCVVGDFLSPPYRTRFLLPQDPHPVGVVHMVLGAWRSDWDARSQDWALLVLERSPQGAGGAHPGWVGVTAQSPMDGQIVATAAYDPYTDREVHQLRCQLRQFFADGSFYHDCDTLAGSSGGPIFAGPRSNQIIGIHNAHHSEGTEGLFVSDYHPDFANVGTSARNFIQSLLQLRRTIP